MFVFVKELGKHTNMITQANKTTIKTHPEREVQSENTL